MEYPAGWLWVLIGIGVIALGVVMFWGEWRKRLSRTKKHEQDEVVKENYRKGG
jgi:O-antigen/teichoic acid export membrane protein